MSQPRRILHLISSLDGYGWSRSLHQLVTQQLADGSRVRVVALSADVRERRLFELAGAACSVLARRWSFDPFAAWRLSRELRLQRYHLLHVWGSAALRYLRFVRPAHPAVPCVATLAELPTDLQKSADCFVLPCPQEIEQPHVVAIAPGVPSPACEPVPLAQFSKLLQLPDNARVIAMAGRLTRDRALEEALWCFELVRTINESARLLVFGDGPDRHRLERFARQACDSSAIRFLGYREDLQRWLPHAEVFWQPSGEEVPAAPPLALLEAMAARVPVVATDVAAHRQAIDPGRTGFLFPVASRSVCARYTLQVLQDRQLASAVSTTAADMVACRYSLSIFLSKYAELYRRMLKDS